jgi:NAD(P)-dependent dehydrogenase (short-subunit alcohol dehydrogenase family)
MTKGEAAGYGLSEEKYIERMKTIHPIGIGEPLDVAFLDLYLASDESKWVTGTGFIIDGGVTAQ